MTKHNNTDVTAENTTIPHALAVHPSAFERIGEAPPETEADSARADSTRHARAAATAFLAYTTVNDFSRFVDARRIMRELLVDLHHLSDACGINFHDVDKEAKSDYTEDIRGDGERRAHPINL